MDPVGPRPKRRGGITLGFMLILLGLMLILRNLGFIHSSNVALWFWGILFISLGLAKLLIPRPDGRREGIGFLFVGSWLLLNQLQLLAYRDSWPILLVGVGTSIVWGALAGRPVKPE